MFYKNKTKLVIGKSKIKKNTKRKKNITTIYLGYISVSFFY